MALVSCQGDKEDKDLLAKFKEQKETIESLDDELRAIRKSIDQIKPPEEIPDLEKLEAEVKQVTEKRIDLEKRIRDLDAQKKKAEEDLIIYQKNYPIR